MYAYFKKLDYFSTGKDCVLLAVLLCLGPRMQSEQAGEGCYTQCLLAQCAASPLHTHPAILPCTPSAAPAECIYSPHAARGFAREFVKDLEVGGGRRSGSKSGAVVTGAGAKAVGACSAQIADKVGRSSSREEGGRAGAACPHALPTRHASTFPAVPAAPPPPPPPASQPTLLLLILCHVPCRPPAPEPSSTSFDPPSSSGCPGRTAAAAAAPARAAAGPWCCRSRAAASGAATSPARWVTGGGGVHQPPKQAAAERCALCVWTAAAEHACNNCPAPHPFCRAAGVQGVHAAGGAEQGPATPGGQPHEAHAQGSRCAPAAISASSSGRRGVRQRRSGARRRVLQAAAAAGGQHCAPRQRSGSMLWRRRVWQQQQRHSTAGSTGSRRRTDGRGRGGAKRDCFWRQGLQLSGQQGRHRVAPLGTAAWSGMRHAAAVRTCKQSASHLQGIHREVPCFTKGIMNMGGRSCEARGTKNKRSRESCSCNHMK